MAASTSEAEEVAFVDCPGVTVKVEPDCAEVNISICFDLLGSLPT